jgi:hypothetical protein
MEKLEHLQQSQAALKRTTEQSAMSVQADIEDMWQCLGGQDDGLSEQLEEQRRQNAMIANLLNETEIECQRQSQLHISANGRAKEKDVEVKGLLARLAATKAAQESNHNLVGHVQQLQAMAHGLSEQLAVKVKQVAELQTKLDTELKKSHIRKSHSSDTDPGRSRVFQAEMQKERQQLVNQIGSLEGDRRQLQERLIDAKNALDNELHQARNTIESLKAQLEARDIRIGVLSHDAERNARTQAASHKKSNDAVHLSVEGKQSIELKHQSCIHELKALLKCSKQPINEGLLDRLCDSRTQPSEHEQLLHTLLEPLRQDTLNNIEDQASNAQQGQKTSCDFSQTLNGGNQDEPQSSPLTDPPSDLGDEWDMPQVTDKRSVSVQTPDIDASTPEPPTVVEEQAKRREGSVPRSILKPATTQVHNEASVPKEVSMGALVKGTTSSQHNEASDSLAEMKLASIWEVPNSPVSTAKKPGNAGGLSASARSRKRAGFSASQPEGEMRKRSRSARETKSTKSAGVRQPPGQAPITKIQDEILSSQRTLTEQDRRHGNDTSQNGGLQLIEVDKLGAGRQFMQISHRAILLNANGIKSSGSMRRVAHMAAEVLPEEKPPNYAFRTRDAGGGVQRAGTGATTTTTQSMNWSQTT